MEHSKNIAVYLFLKTSQIGPDGMGPLYAKVLVGGQRPFELSTKIRLPVKGWDQKNQMIKNPGKNMRLHQQVVQFLERMLNLLEKLRLANGMIDRRSFSDELHGKKEPEQRITYKFIYKKHFEIHAEDIAPGTWKNYRSTHRRFLEFLREELRTDDLDLSRFNRQLVIEFIAWLKKRVPDPGQRKCTQTTAQKHTERIMKLLSFAVEMQYLSFQPVSGLKKKHVLKSRVCLEQPEMDALKNCAFPKKYLQEVRDTFLFSCYTGLSYSDILTLNRDDLVKDMTGNWAISKVRAKTHRTRQIEFFVPLLPPAMELLEKYRDHPHCRIKNVLLPVRINQAYNRHLKEIAKLAGIDKNLTTHVARHTFATTVTQDNGVSLEAISEMLGHTQIRTTQIYSKTTIKRVTNEMNALKNTMIEDDKRFHSL